MSRLQVLLWHLFSYVLFSPTELSADARHTKCSHSNLWAPDYSNLSVFATEATTVQTQFCAMCGWEPYAGKAFPCNTGPVALNNGIRTEENKVLSAAGKSLSQAAVALPLAHAANFLSSCCLVHVSGTLQLGFALVHKALVASICSARLAQSSSLPSFFFLLVSLLLQSPGLMPSSAQWPRYPSSWILDKWCLVL